jgi:hypothetical protein
VYGSTRWLLFVDSVAMVACSGSNPGQRIACSGDDHQRSVPNILKRSALRQRSKQFGKLAAGPEVRRAGPSLASNEDPPNRRGDEFNLKVGSPVFDRQQESRARATGRSLTGERSCSQPR